MDYLINPNIFEIINNMSSIILSYTGTFMSLSLGIASILIMFVISKESYNLMLGGKSFDPIWWIRPLLILLIILTWNAGGSRSGIQGSLPSIISTVFGGLEAPAKNTFMMRMSTLEERKKKKSELLSKKWDELLQKGAEVEASKQALDKVNKEDEDGGFSLDPSEWKASISKGFDSIKEGIVNYTKVVLLQISSWVDKLLEWIGNLIWAIAVYATFMTKSISIAFLTIFGPISFALSVYDLWRDAWASWLMRFISFQFYGFVAYIIMTASCSIIDFGIRADIALLSQPGFPEAFSFNAVYTLFGYLIGAMAMKMVPEVVSWIVPTNSSQAAGQFGQGMASMAMKPMQRAVNSLDKLKFK